MTIRTTCVCQFARGLQEVLCRSRSPTMHDVFGLPLVHPPFSHLSARRVTRQQQQVVCSLFPFTESAGKLGLGRLGSSRRRRRRRWRVFAISVVEHPRRPCGRWKQKQTLSIYPTFSARFSAALTWIYLGLSRGQGCRKSANCDNKFENKYLFILKRTREKRI